MSSCAHIPGFIPCVENLNILWYSVEPRTTELETVPVDSLVDVDSVECPSKHAPCVASEECGDDSCPPVECNELIAALCSEWSAEILPACTDHLEVTEASKCLGCDPEPLVERGVDS